MLIRRIIQVSICALALLPVWPGEAFSGALSVSTDLQKAEVEVISNPKTPVPPPGQRKKIVFKEELSIGEKEGDENYMFGSDVFFNTDDEGNFYVTDWDKRKILKYDPSGKYLLTIGRQGQGPGEFQNLSIARFDTDGNIYVTDLASRRISFFSKRGNYLRQILIPDVFEDLYLGAKGGYVSSRTMRQDSATGMAFKIVDGFFNDKFELVTEFIAQNPTMNPPSGRDSTAMARFTAGILSGMAYKPSPRHVVAADGTIYFGYPEDYVISVYSPEGRKTKTIRRDCDPIKVKDRDKDYFAEKTAKPFVIRSSSVRSSEGIEDILKFIEYPAYKPAYQSFCLMQNGWLVVLVELAGGEYSLFDIFDENGRYIGQFEADLTAEYGWLFFKNNKAYAVVTDEEGYKSIKRYDVTVVDY
jgi:hypothetical protein